MTLAIVLFSLASSSSLARADNLLPSGKTLRHQYVGMRHGESFSNLEKRVCSSMKAGTAPENGLTDKGKNQAKESAQKWAEANPGFLKKAIQERRLRVVASPFSRAQDTAKILVRTLEDYYRGPLKGGSESIPIETNDDLRERFFGEYEGQSTPEGFWEKLNAKDEANPHQNEGGVETVNQMETRVTQVIASLEKRKRVLRGEPDVIFIVSHSDPLSSLQNAFEKKPVARYVHVPRFKTAEIRELKRQQ